MKLHQKHSVLATLNVIVWSLIGLAWKGTIQLGAMRHTEVSVEVDPSRVVILVDGSPVSKNISYLDTPTDIMVTPGRRKITVQRTGYHSQTSTLIVGTNHEKQKITAVLEPSAEIYHAVSFELSEASSDSDVVVSIDNGFYEGPLPLEAKDLLPGVHYVDLTAGTFQKIRTRCQLDLPMTAQAEPKKVVVDHSGKKLKIQGCKRVK